MGEKDYKFNLIYEYREVVTKVQNLERFIVNNEQKTLAENDEKRLALLREQLDILKQYENIPGYIVEGNLKDKVVEEIPQFEGTLKQLDNLCNIKAKENKYEKGRYCFK